MYLCTCPFVVTLLNTSDHQYLCSTVHRPDHIEADLLITAHMRDLDVKVVRSESQTRTIRKYSVCWSTANDGSLVVVDEQRRRVHVLG